MTLTEVALSTPEYVLREANNHIGPELVPLASGRTCSAVFGFSDKVPYDSFCSNTARPLTPYPLVRGYLRSQLESAGDGLLLVIVDAVSPSEPTLQAATMKAVLDAQESKAKHVTATYRLVLEPKAKAYRVQEVDAQKQ